jgi:hypothetical protein
MCFRKRHSYFVRRLVLGLAVAAVAAPTALGTYQEGEGVRSVTAQSAAPQWLQALEVRSEALNHLYGLERPGGVIGFRAGGQIPQGLLPNGSTIEQFHRNPDAASPAVYSTGVKAPEPRPLGRGYFGAPLPSGQRTSDARVDFGDSATGFGIAAGLGLLAAAAMMLRNRRKLATGF